MWDSLRIYHYLSADLEPLRQFPGLRHLRVDWATKVTDLSPVAALVGLEDLEINDLARVSDLSPLRHLVHLKSLAISGGMEKAMRVDTLKWITSLEGLRSVELFHLRIADNDITVLARLPRLESLRLANMWPMEQFAVLVASYETAMRFPLPTDELDKCPECGTQKVMLIGIGKPVLCPHCDESRLSKELEEWERAVAAAKAAS